MLVQILQLRQQFLRSWLKFIRMPLWPLWLLGLMFIFCAAGTLPEKIELRKEPLIFTCDDLTLFPEEGTEDPAAVRWNYTYSPITALRTNSRSQQRQSWIQQNSDADTPLRIDFIDNDQEKFISFTPLQHTFLQRLRQKILPTRAGPAA